MPHDEPSKPEDHELSLKRQDLLVLESALADRELELATLQSSLHAFERRSKSELDPRYEQLATLQQQIAELQQRIGPAPAPAAHRKSDNAPKPPRTPDVPRKRRPRPAVPEEPSTKPVELISPAETLRRLYRDVAKAVHPDLADDDIERQHRHALMVKANEAYDSGDEARLSAILLEWENSPEAIRGHGTIPDLIRTIRKIHRCKLRLAQIAVEIKRLTGTSLFNLKGMAEAAQNFDRDLLAEMTGRLDQQIAEAQEKLSELEKVAPPAPPTPSPEYEPLYVQTFTGDSTPVES